MYNKTPDVGMTPSKLHNFKMWDYYNKITGLIGLLGDLLLKP